MSEDFIKIIVADGTDRRLDKFIGKLSDSTTMTKILRILVSKYGLRANWKEVVRPENDFLNMKSDFLDFG